MLGNIGKTYGVSKLLDPAQSTVVFSPLGTGPGWWVGAPSATFDSLTNRFYLVYRHRRPRELGRGIECRIASSDDGVTFVDIWRLPKAALDALSVERCSLHRAPNGRWLLYLSYVDASDLRWRISVIEAAEPDRFDVAAMRTLFRAEDLGCDGVKDPNVFQFGPMIYMLVSYAGHDGALPDDAHATADVYNTGLVKSRTGAAVSGDGVHFLWLGDVSPASKFLPSAASASESASSWDAYCRRISTILPLGSGGYLALYDGSASVAENYEEKTGLAVTFDLRTYYSLSPEAPILESDAGSGSLRYADVLSVGHELFYYYESAREDGSHDLRVSVVDRD